MGQKLKYTLLVFANVLIVALESETQGNLPQAFHYTFLECWQLFVTGLTTPLWAAVIVFLARNGYTLTQNLW